MAHANPHTENLNAVELFIIRTSRDGTLAAAAHVTGLAALVLAHHLLFQQEGFFAVRTEQRVQALLDLIQASAVPHTVRSGSYPSIRIHTDSFQDGPG